MMWEDIEIIRNNVMFLEKSYILWYNVKEMLSRGWFIMIQKRRAKNISFDYYLFIASYGSLA